MCCNIHMLQLVQKSSQKNLRVYQDTTFSSFLCFLRGKSIHFSANLQIFSELFKYASNPFLTISLLKTHFVRARLEETLLKTHFVRMSEQSSSGYFKNERAKLERFRLVSLKEATRDRASPGISSLIFILYGVQASKARNSGVPGS